MGWLIFCCVRSRTFVEVLFLCPEFRDADSVFKIVVVFGALSFGIYSGCPQCSESFTDGVFKKTDVTDNAFVTLVTEFFKGSFAKIAVDILLGL